MSFALFKPILALRYRLLWANVRTRQGRIAIFVVLYFLGTLFALLLALGGLGAAFAGLQSGRAAVVARVLFGSFFVQAILTALVLGIGLNKAFSDAALRRYPLTTWQRFAARHAVGLLDPIWIFAAVLYFAVAAGFSYFGDTPAVVVLPVALLLTVANYLTARLVVALLERLLATRSGALLLMLSLLLFSTGGGALARYLSLHPEHRPALLAVMRLTPPFSAAAAVSGEAVLALVQILFACGLLTLALVYADRLPIPARAAAPRAAIAWDGPCDRLAALLSPRLAPLVAKGLRYHFRSPQFRFNYPITLPLLVYLAYTLTEGRGGPSLFSFSLCAAGGLGLLSTGGYALNMFGFDGYGFRRYFLLPIPPRDILRAGSLVDLAIGGSLLPVALGLYLFFAQIPSDSRVLAMLIANGCGGLLLFQALGVWTSIYGPRQMDFTIKFGNRLPLAANIVLIGGVFSVMLLPLALRKVPTAVILDHWWLSPLYLAAAAVFYFFTLSRGAVALDRRRERMTAAIEKGI